MMFVMTYQNRMLYKYPEYLKKYWPFVVSKMQYMEQSYAKDNPAAPT